MIRESTCGRFGYITLAVLGVPSISEGGTKSKVGQRVGGLATSPLLSQVSPTLQRGGQNQNRAHMWADWLHHPYCSGGPQCFGAGDKIRMRPTCGRIGYITFAVSGVLNTSERGKKSEMSQHVGGLATSPLLSRGSPLLRSGGPNQNRAHMWAVWLHHHCCLGGSQRFKAVDKIKIGPTCGRFGYITLDVSGVPNASEGRTKSEVANMWADWLHHPCCPGGPQRFKAVDKIRIGPTCGRFGYITLDVSGVPSASEWGTKSEMGQHVGGLAASPLLSRGSRTLHSGGQNLNRAHM